MSAAAGELTGFSEKQACQQGDDERDAEQEEGVAKGHDIGLLAQLQRDGDDGLVARERLVADTVACLLYTSPSPRDRTRSRMPSSA